MFWMGGYMKELWIREVWTLYECCLMFVLQKFSGCDAGQPQRWSSSSAAIWHRKRTSRERKRRTWQLRGHRRRFENDWNLCCTLRLPGYDGSEADAQKKLNFLQYNLLSSYLEIEVALFVYVQCICLSMYISAYVCVSISMCICIYVCIYIYVYLYVFMYYIYVYLCVWMVFVNAQMLFLHP